METASTKHPTTTKPLAAWAAGEAERVFRSRKITADEAAIAAARRAPGLKAAAEALHAILISGDSVSIPAELATLVEQSAVPSTDTELVAKCKKWLHEFPHELKRCRSAAAALAAMAPIALISVQLPTTERDPELEAQCKARLANLRRPISKVSLSHSLRATLTANGKRPLPFRSADRHRTSVHPPPRTLHLASRRRVN